MTAPRRLAAEHLGDAILGLGVRRPRLSWWLPAGAARQHAFHVVADGWDSGRVESDQSVLVPWGGEDLPDATRVSWRVRVWTDLGESDWSRRAWFETGLLDPAAWVGRWISPHEPVVPDERPAYVLRTTFELGAVPPTARLYATARGLYETFLNGARVGDLELTPGFTSYWANLHVQTYDVGDLLLEGSNVWEVRLSDGWFRGRVGFTQERNASGDRVAFLGELHAGGKVIASGPGWESAVGSIVAADVMAGQCEDHRRVAEGWQPVVVGDGDTSTFAVSPAPPVRRVQELQPVAVTRPLPDRQVIDLGQNINGWVRLTQLGPAGTALSLTHGEALDGDGDVTQDHLRAVSPMPPTDLAVGMIDRVVSAGDDDVFEPRHTAHGFQFVRVEGHPGTLTVDDATGVVVHTDLRRTGWFRCSDERINRLHDIADWSFRGNACDIPTDCPHRERAGWTGDWQVFQPTAAFLYDVAGFSLKWLRDLAADQRPDGCVCNFAPDPMRQKAMAADVEMWKFMQGSSGWGDAVVLVPWDLWRAYGDAGVLAELWPAMVAWVDFSAGRARTMRHPSREAARPVAAPHEQFLWDGGWHWGEWLEPGGDGDFWSADHGAVGTAYLAHTSGIAAQIGRILGHHDDADRFDELSAGARDAWQHEFINDDGQLSPSTQATYVRALAFDLVPHELRAATADGLVRLVRDAGTHLATGFLATPHLLPVLADNGHLDVAYELLFQDTEPSWLRMVDAGATTVWEQWDGIDAEGQPHASLNHYSKGAVISFLHTRVAGVQIAEPAYRRFRVAPQPGGGIGWAEAVHDSPYGRIASSWRRDDDRFTVVVEVPGGTSATVELPDGSTREQAPGTAVYEWKRS